MSNANSNKYTVTRKMYICRDHRAHRGLGLDESEFTKSVVFFIFYFIRPYSIRELGLWLRLECSFDSLSIDPAHVIYLAEGHNVGSERQSSVMTLRKPIVTWII